MELTYNPEIFSVQDLAQARGIILTDEGGSTDQRWKDETPVFCDLLATHHKVPPESLVLDYGCGIGRMARELIARHGCRVIGVDISPSMRALAVGYVSSDNFFSCTPSMLAVLLNQGLRFDFALSIWVLQHCFSPGTDIESIKQALKPGGGLFVVNNVHRAVPTKEMSWADDGIDIRNLLTDKFSSQAGDMLFSPTVAPALSGMAFWAALRNGGSEAA